SCAGGNPLVCTPPGQCYQIGTCDPGTGCPAPTFQPLGTVCNQSGGSACDGTGNCVQPPSVTATTPGDGSSVVANTTLSIDFSTAMNAATLTAQTSAGACSGSIQVSL